jgi:tRNA (guanine-N7-)-methyltransferase
MSPSTPVVGPAEASRAASDERAHRAPRSYVVRNGRMGPGQARALADLGPSFVLPYVARPLDAEAVFERRAPLVVEIGFGMGSATAQIAAAHPEVDFLGIEVHPPGVGALLKRIGEDKLRNVRIVCHDAVDVLEHMIGSASLAGINIFFPDPWPKKRHHKRRLLQPPFVGLAASRLAPGATLHCATDDQPYAEQMLGVLSAEPALANTCEGFAQRPAQRPLTKFEHRGLIRGHGVWDLVFVRRDAPPSASALLTQQKGSRRSAAGPGLARPGDCATVCGGQHDDAEGDAIPGERRKGVRRDVAQQPAHADQRGDEREDEADGEKRNVSR